MHFVLAQESTAPSTVDAVHPIFLSVVVILRNQSKELADVLRQLEAQIAPLASDYEIIAVDNASIDTTCETLRQLTRREGHPNLHVLSLPLKAAADVAAWIGVEQTIGDFVAVVDPVTDDLTVTPQLVDSAVSGHDIVYGRNSYRPKRALHYRLLSAGFKVLFRALGGSGLALDAPRHRVLSRKVVNHLMGQSDPSIAYRCLALGTGFSVDFVEHTSTNVWRRSVSTRESVDRAIQLLLTVSKLPMRLGTGALLFMSSLDVVVTFLGLFDGDGVGVDRIILSLLFLSLASALAVVGEYLLKINDQGRAANAGLQIRFSSEVMTAKEKLNIDSVDGAETMLPPQGAAHR